MAYRMGLLGKKIGMTQNFDAKGVWAALSVIQTGPCVVLEVLTPEKHGYSAIRLGFDERSPSRTNKPLTGQFVKAGTTPKSFIREIRLGEEEAAKFSVGQVVSIGEVFRPGDHIDVTAISKGKGFRGVMKRHHFSGFRATHGTHEYFRHGGSIGCRLTPGRVFKGKRMPGHMGNARVTVQNIVVVEVIEQENLLLIKGGVPGPRDGYVIIRQATKHLARPFSARPAAAPAPEPAPPAPADQAGAGDLPAEG